MTTTPYLEGSSTWVTRMVPSAPVFLWNASISFSGKSQMTSLHKRRPPSGHQVLKTYTPLLALP